MQHYKQIISLTIRQKEIMSLVAEGKQNAEVARALRPPITEGSVKQHLYKIFRKLEVDNRVEAINKYRTL